MRNYFRIHLSTAIVLMLTAGVLLWAHLSATSYDYVRKFNVSEVEAQISVSWGSAYGWPFRCCWVDIDGTRWDYPDLICDVLVTLGILGLVKVLCEWWIRLRARSSAE